MNFVVLFYNLKCDQTQIKYEAKLKKLLEYGRVKQFKDAVTKANRI